MVSYENKAILEERGIKESDVEEVIASGAKIKNGAGDILSKKKIGDVTYYAVTNGDVVKTAYSHRMNVGDIVNVQSDSEWVCVKCNEAAKEGTADVEYMGTKRSGPAIVCPKCGGAWIEEYLATKTIAVAEGLFEAKDRKSVV